MNVLLLLALILTPGPLDRNGGHIDPLTGEYHLHAGPSYQFRYVDATGKIWEGNSPLPRENLRDSSKDFIWETPFIFILIAVGIVGGITYYYIEEYIKRRRRNRRYRKIFRREY